MYVYVCITIYIVFLCLYVIYLLINNNIYYYIYIYIIIYCIYLLTIHIHYLQLIEKLCGTRCLSNTNANRKKAASAMAVVTYTRAVQRNLIKGLATYNILQNPIYKESFAITWKFAMTNKDVRSVRNNKVSSSRSSSNSSSVVFIVCTVIIVWYSLYPKELRSSWCIFDSLIICNFMYV